jgi:hypothetical protein
VGVLSVGVVAAVPLVVRQVSDDTTAVVAAPAGGGQSRGDVFSLPPPGRIVAQFLSDGTPIFIRRGTDDSVTVVSAVDTHRPFNVGDLVWWCPSSRQFEEPQSGTHYDETGRAVGGPAPRGLTTYDWEEVGTDRSSIRVLSATAPVPRDPSASPGRASCFAGSGNEPGQDVVRHHYPIRQAKVYSPDEAVHTRTSDYVQIHGVVDMDGDRVRACERLVGSQCSGAARVRNVIPVDGHQIADGLFLARVSNRQLSDVVLVKVTYRDVPPRPARCFRDIGASDEVECGDYRAMFDAAGTAIEPEQCYIISGFFPQGMSCPPRARVER